MSVIISISGPQNSGKTTLVNKLKETGLYYVEQRSYRDLIKEKGLAINQNGTFENQMIIMEFMIEQLKQLHKSEHEIVILDRSIFDCYVYSKFLFYNKKITHEQFKKLSNLYFYNVDLIYGIINLKYNSNITLVDDQLRDIDINYILIIDEIFQESIREYSNLRYVNDGFYTMNLYSNNVEEKLQHSIDFIKGCVNMSEK